jgi:hypothetical protein
MIYRNRDVAHGKERREADTSAWNRAFTETVMWPTVTRVPFSARPRFGSAFLIAVEMGRFGLDPQPHTSIG